MLFLAFLPEIASFLLFMAATTQRFEIGTLMVAAQLGLAGILLLLKPMSFLHTLSRWWPLLTAPMLCVISSLWSAAPDASLRYGAQLLFSAALGVHLARLMTPGRFITVFLLAMFAFCLLCVIDGRKGPAADGMVLIGLTGSKNQLGFAGVFLLLSGLTALLMSRVSITVRWIALLAVPLALYLLWSSHAATAVVMGALGSIVLLVVWFSQRLQPSARLAAILGALVVTAPLTALTPEATEAVDHFVFDTLNKDPTLTGRTILWQRADELIAQRPVLGWGYQAIWMGDSYETIGLKRLTGMNDGRVFHFHHQFRQIGVDTGWVGIVAFVLTLLAAFFAGFRQLLLAPHPATTFFFVMFALMIVRAFTDTVLAPFSIHTMMFYSSAAYAFWRPPVGASEAHARANAIWPTLHTMRLAQRNLR